MKQVDYIIVGQGISGSFLAWYLHKANQSFIVIDNIQKNTASKVASGVINPITGRRFVRTWMIEELMPFAVDAYNQLGKVFKSKFIHQKNIVNFHTTPQMQLAFEERIQNEQDYLSNSIDESLLSSYFNYNFGIGLIKPCWWINVQLVLSHIQQWLQQKDSIWEHDFVIDDLQVFESHIVYNNIEAKKVFFCDGIKGTDNRFFEKLPYAVNKGEAIIFSVKDALPPDFIFKQGLTITPWKDNNYWIGSTYEWKYTDTNPTEEFKQKVITTLNFWLKQPFKIEEHLASIRPANIERRPFVGLHPKYNSVGILNGMGAKGCSLAPYFAKQLVDNLVSNEPINEMANVNRFRKILATNNLQ